ncbi:Zinc finger protein [Pseudolycoriella hygida]|uniref:Zinc finger protein n=1 Tax=Pseudolycoriella hygida TaxID=35572 RepID=A0A9Q0RZH3_9DIPT|nr:Zinc finger protein [Pseudolycoriella hygida]
MENNEKSGTDTCEKCIFQNRIIQKYSEEIVDLQRQVSVLSSRLLKYEPDPPIESLCVVKLENNSDDEFVSDLSVVRNSDDGNDCKDETADVFSESSRDGLLDDEFDAEEANPDENSDSSEFEVKKKGRAKKTTRKWRKCKNCEEEFSSSRGLLKHNHIVHGDPIKFKCDRCPRTFFDSNSLKKHSGTKHKSLEKEKVRFFCDTCAKSFTSKSVLIVHKRIHTGEKPYKCKSCDNRYAQSSSLRIHERTHSLERPYMCHLCSKTFLHRSSFNLHIKTHGDIRPHKCQICEKAFLQKAKLVVHMQSHTGERPVKCPVCDKGYTKRYHVRKHLKNFHKINDVDAVLGSRKRGFEREPVPYQKLESLQIKKE